MKGWRAIGTMVLLFAGCSAPQPSVRKNAPAVVYDELREAVLRAIAGHDSKSYFVAFCVAAVPSEVAAAQDRQARVGTAWGVESPDASESLLSRLRNSAHRFVPASGCVKTEGDYDVVVAETKRGPALLVGIGPVQVISPRKAEIVTFTTSGYLTETATAYSLEQSAEGIWLVAREEILFQV